VATGVEAEVQAIGNLSLVLAGGFTLELHNQELLKVSLDWRHHSIPSMGGFLAC